MENQYKTIIASLNPETIFKNSRGNFCDVKSSFLCVGAATTDKRRVLNLDRFHYKGWYRFFDLEEAGDLETFAGGVNDPVNSDDEARLRVIDRAIADVLIRECEDLANEVGAIPYSLNIITARDSLAKTLSALIADNDEEFSLFGHLKRHLGYLTKVQVSVVSKDIVTTIFRFKNVSQGFCVS